MCVFGRWSVIKRIGVFMALLLMASCPQAGAQSLEPPDTLKSLPEELARELRTITKSGCKESWSDPSVPNLIRNCTRVIERKNLTDRQRSFAYFVRGSLKGFSHDATDSKADFAQSIALNPSFGPAYDSRGGGANADRESAIRDYQKAIELGYRDGFGPLIMAQWRLECPTLAYKGNECLPVGGTHADRYECDASAQLPVMCVWKQKGSPKGLVDCEPGFGPGLGCALAAPDAPAFAEEPPRLIVADAPATPPPAATAGQVQRVVLGPSSMFPQLASPEMLPALKPGDEVEIAPYAGSPKAGDVIAFKHPVDGSTVVARRLVGLPGDEVEVRAGVVLLNGAVIPRMQVGTVGTAASYQETLPNGTEYVVLDDGPNAPFDNAGPLKVPAGHYFVLGDNRDHSLDSRAIFVFGYVPAANIVGRVQKPGAPTPPASPSPVATAPQAEPAPPAEKPGWLTWLWGSKKPAAPTSPPPEPKVAAASPPPAAAPSPSAAPPTSGPTTTVQYAGKDIVLEAPAGACFVPPDNEILTLFFTKIAQPSKDGRWRILAGYKECDTPPNDFRAQLGAYGVREDIVYDGPQRDAASRDAPYKMCESLGARTDLAVETLDEAIVAKLVEGAQGASADPENFFMQPLVVGMHGSLCTVVRPWALNRAKPPYMLFTGIFPLKSRLIFLTASPAYSGPQSPQAEYTRLREMIRHMTTLNYEK